MQRSLNILWKKTETEDSNVYIDIFKIPGYCMNIVDMKELINSYYRIVQVYTVKKHDKMAQDMREQGKRDYEEKNYFLAMKSFNDALLNAPKKSMETGLNYANRSSVYFNLKMLEECLLDIELARKSNYPENLIHKLDSRITKVQSLMNNEEYVSTIFTPSVPTLNFTEHKMFRGVADCLKIEKNEEFGRHVITTCDLKIGQTILVEQPYAISPARRDMNGRDRCRHCFKDRMNFIPCKACIGALFCNDDCMEKSFHKYECDMPYMEMCNSESFEMVMELLVKIVAAFPDIDHLIETVELLLSDQQLTQLTNEQRAFCSIFQLENHHEKKSPEQLRWLLSTSGNAILTFLRFPEFKQKFTNLKHNRFLQHLTLHLFHVAEHRMKLFECQQDDKKLMMNCKCEQSYASAIYPFGCYINHSCVPNICRIYVGSLLVCKVIKPIKKGEQIFCSYL